MSDAHESSVDEGWRRAVLNREEDDDDNDTVITLQRLIRKHEAPLSLQEQLQQVDHLIRMAREHPELFERRNNDGLLPLHVALSNDVSLEMIQILVEAHPSSLFERFGTGMTAIRQAKTRPALDYLLDRAVTHLDSTRGWEDVQFFFASHYDMENVVQRLVDEFGVSFLSREGTFDMPPHSYEKRLPLHYAIQQRATLEILTILIEGYPRSLYATMKSNGESPLHHACRISHVVLPLIKLLADGKSARIRDTNKRLPIHVYCQRQVHIRNAIDVGVIDFLIEVCPDSAALVDGNGMLPIHHACQEARQENLPAIQTLVQAYPQGLDVENNLGLTPIFVACQDAVRIENIPVIQYLAQACPTSVSRLNGFGITVLHWYFGCLYDYASVSIVETLVRANPTALEIKDAKGLTPFHHVCASRNVPMIRYMAEQCPEILESNSDDEIGTPLHVFCRDVRSTCQPLGAETLEALRVLALSEKAVQARNNEGQTPLHSLCGEGESREILMILLKRAPAAAQARDGNGSIPLHCAIQGFARERYLPFGLEDSCYKETIQCLLELFPLGVRVADEKGRTPLMLACEFGLSLSLIYQLVKTDPISNNQGWSQILGEYNADDSVVVREKPSLFSYLVKAFGFLRGDGG